MFTTETIKLLY